MYEEPTDNAEQTILILKTIVLGNRDIKAIQFKSQILFLHYYITRKMPHKTYQELLTSADAV